MIHEVEPGLTYDSDLEVWSFEGDYVSFMNQGAATRILNHIARCEANARREFAEVVRLYSLIRKVDPSSSVALSSGRSPPEEPT